MKNYTKNTDIDDPETLNDASQMLVISEADYFNFAVNDSEQGAS